MMEHLKPFQILLTLVLTVLYLGACANPAPPSVEGSLFLYWAGNIFEIPSGSTTKNATDLRIAGPDIYERSIYLWSNYLAYSTYNDIQLLNLDTREVKTFSTGPANCFTLSPDLAYISYAYNGKLYLYDSSSGTSSLVYEAPSGTYSDGRTYYGGVTCGAWIGPDRFVFERQVGMPTQLTTINGVADSVGLNTTTLAIISETLTLIDSPQQLSVYSISGDGKHMFFQKKGKGIFPDLYYASLPPSFSNFESLRPRLIVPEYLTNHFTISDSEIIYEDYKDGVFQIRIINLETFEARSGPKTIGDLYWIWVGDPKNNLIAYQYDDGEVWLVDLNTDAGLLVVSDALVKDMETLGMDVPQYSSHYLIGWLPSK